MENWIRAPWTDIICAVLIVVMLYVGVLIITKIRGLRALADFTSVDFVSTIALGSIIGTYFYCNCFAVGVQLPAIANN